TTRTRSRAGPGLAVAMPSSCQPVPAPDCVQRQPERWSRRRGDDAGMSRGGTHICLDFFGTLVDYSDSRTEQGYQRSHDVLRGFGAALTYEEMLETWTRISDDFDRETEKDEHEY